jgi:predicted RNA-binding Zn-ribbon protein involved in translation (DUF1610 family)
MRICTNPRDNKNGNSLMTDDVDLQQPRFEHFHVCIHCGGALRREEFSGRTIISGIYTCPKCGFDSPLIVEVREVESPDKSRNDSPDDDSSGQR